MQSHASVFPGGRYQGWTKVRAARAQRCCRTWRPLMQRVQLLRGAGSQQRFEAAFARVEKNMLTCYTSEAVRCASAEVGAFITRSALQTLEEECVATMALNARVEVGAVDAGLNARLEAQNPFFAIQVSKGARIVMDVGECCLRPRCHACA